MNANPLETGGTPGTGPERGDERRSERSRNAAGNRLRQYMVAPADRSMTAAVLVQRLSELGIADLVRTIEPRGALFSPVAIVRMSAQTAAILRASSDTLIVEPDPPLQAASISMAPASICAATTAALAVLNGPGFTTTIQVLGERETPIERAMVELVARSWVAQGVTDGSGKTSLKLTGELAAAVSELLVKPRKGYWSLCRSDPEVMPDAVNPVTLRPLVESNAIGWGSRAMRFDQLPSQYRGGGVKIALIDSGVAANHPQLATVKRGLDAARGDERSWSRDAVGHGTPCAGVLVAAAENTSGVRGYAPDTELHVYKLPPDASCSDLVAAIDYCVEAGIDIACVGFGCNRGSTIVERCIMAAKQQGIAVVAAAGSTAGPVQFPACSPHVLGVGAIGRAGTFPPDSLHAVLAEAAANDWTALSGSGFFVPAFSCAGPEVDLCGPGVAVISCQSPDGYAACDGTSIAAPHVAALAALALAHRSEFRRDFARRDARRVERLFQVLKENARPLGDPLRSGAGLPDAPQVLGLHRQTQPSVTPAGLGLSELRAAMQIAGLAASSYEEASPEPPRGPAAAWPAACWPGSAMPPPLTPSHEGLEGLKEALILAGLSPGR
jgi:subtilisin